MKRLNEVNKVNDISLKNENSVSLSYAKFEICFISSNSLANSRDANPVFWLSSQIAIRSNFTQCHCPARLIQRNPERSSRKDKCKLLAL
jgi:hypothetical protein